MHHSLFIMEQIENKVAKSNLITIDLEYFYPKEEIVTLDISQFLTDGIILKEKEYRNQLKETDWSIYKDKIVLLTISEEAIVPQWTYMLCASFIQPFCSKVFQGSRASFLLNYYQNKISEIDQSQYIDKPIIIKGCSKKDVPSNAYIFILEKLQPVVKSLMFGEACSSVPIYKKKKE